jgi:hypothetical protein
MGWGAYRSEGALDALLDHVGGKFVLRKLKELPAELVKYGGLVLRLAVLEHVLDYVVSVLVLHQRYGAS